MNATSRNPRGGLDDTVAYVPLPAPCSDGSHPAAGSRTAHRYAFGSGSRPLEGYTIKRAIGRGGFGEVYYAVSDAGKEVALKLVTRNLEIERRGVLHCMNLKSPHLITIFDLRTSEAGDTFVIMEYVSGPSLASILADHPHGLPLPEVRAWLKGLVAGVSYLHDHGVVHRDLKPANLFLEEGIVKIGDYGLSKSITTSNEVALTENVGTCHYMAPEISRGKYHKPIDIYAIGVILYEMLTGMPPFEGETAQEVLWKHLTDQPDLSKVAEPYRSILRRALAKDPNHRPQRPEELLPPQDTAAVAPEPIRFLERRASAPRLSEVEFPGPADPARPTAAARPAGGDVLVIRDEEPPLYIGPEAAPRRPAASTSPPRPVSRAEIRRAAWQQRRRIREQCRRARAEASARCREARRPPVVPPADLEPPPLPSGRVRVAELAGSMVAAAPLAALASALVLPFYRITDIDLPADPLQLAFLFAIVLAGVWSVLITTKLWEGRPVVRSTRRLCLLGVGLGLGVVAMFLGDWTRLGPSPVHLARGQAFRVATFHPAPAIDSLVFMTYMGVVFAANGWWKLTARDRSSRFRIWPVVKAGLIAGLIGAVWPSPQPWATVLIVLMAILIQLVSPWSRQAAVVAGARRLQNVT